MSQLDLLAKPRPTLLRMPSWLGKDVSDEHELPHSPGDYKVTPGGEDDRWMVTCLKTGEVVYRGIGPVEVVRSLAPF
ncbi:hypothetical protein [Variovorax sp. JS1663]|uniref:hypothetical protein n=1 Tax=Variovorax sp. JS1663 TaxID=1851577 RepID=UPI000B348B00|nr:hypothetical protein [Variovorax sp. JS1663]OUM01737.1 hypothetical protein A8M77_14340 [Variovorax sp. JS1663]